jgi:hypothetical protein
MKKETKSVKSFLQAALILHSTEVDGLWGSGKLSHEEKHDLVHLSATVSNCLGELEGVLEKFNLKKEWQ